MLEWSLGQLNFIAYEWGLKKTKNTIWHLKRELYLELWQCLAHVEKEVHGVISHWFLDNKHICVCCSVCFCKIQYVSAWFSMKEVLRRPQALRKTLHLLKNERLSRWMLFWSWEQKRFKNSLNSLRQINAGIYLRTKLNWSFSVQKLQHTTTWVNIS